MAQALILAVSNCGCCKQFEAKPQIPGMQPIICTEPMELVHVDYVGIEVTVATQEKPVRKNVLVVVDHFTQYVQAFVTRNQMARTTTRVLYNEYFSVFGFPQRLISDQGTGFTSKVIQAMCSLLGIEKIRTTPYHPQSNSSAERVHQTLRRMIGKLDLEHPEMAGTFGVRAHSLQRYPILSYGVFTILPNVWPETLATH